MGQHLEGRRACRGGDVRADELRESRVGHHARDGGARAQGFRSAEGAMVARRSDARCGRETLDGCPVRRQQVVALAIAFFIARDLGAQTRRDPRAWPAVERDSRPWTRCWWMGSAVT